MSKCDNYEHNREMMVDAIRCQRDPPPQYQAPAKDQKWRARDLLDIHWKLVGIECPASYNRIMSCIVGHANPLNGVCYPRHKTIARETGYSVETVKRAVRWWIKQGYLKTENRGLAHALAYHPQWALFEMFWTAVAADIAAQKPPEVIPVTYAKVTKGTYDEGQYGDLQNLKERTSKKESHPKGDHQPSAAGSTHSSMNERESLESPTESQQVESQRASREEVVKLTPPESPLEASLNNWGEALRKRNGS